MSEQKEYPNSSVYERHYIVKLFNNLKIQEECLDSTLPGIFLDGKKRYIVYLMKRLKEKKMAITVDNMVIFQANPDDSLMAFLRKQHKNVYTSKPLSDDELKKFFLSEGDIYDIVHDVGIDAQADSGTFEIIKKEMLLMSFARFIEDMLPEIKHYNKHLSEQSQYAVISKLKAGTKLYDILHTRMESKQDVLVSAMNYINSEDEYIRTSSRVLNSFIGGFSRGYVNTIIAKSSHCKSSWTDFNIADCIINNKAEKIVKITPEEDSDVQIRRFIAMICKIPTNAMLLKTVKITTDHIKLVKDTLAVGNRLVIYDKYQDEGKIKEIINSLTDADMIVVDHVNSIDYPGRNGWLNNMINGIPGFINFCKSTSKRVNTHGKKTSTILLSQVGDKEIQRSERLSKAPRFYDAYGSSALYQASRQMLALYYPYKDQDDMGISLDNQPCGINDVQIAIEKSSFSMVGKVQLYFDPNLNLFKDSDAAKKKLKALSYEAPNEQLF